MPAWRSGSVTPEGPEQLEVRLAVIGDVHARRSTLEPVLGAIAERGVHGVLLVGDLGSMLPRHRAPRDGERRRYLRSVEGVLDAVADLGVPLAYVPGNHDLPDLDFPGNADRTVVEVAGVRVTGIGGSPDDFGDPYEFDDADVADLVLPEAEVLLVHTPPARTPLDRVPRRDQHVGSEAIRGHALAHRGVLVCGHIHESPGACRLGDCLCLNAGGLGRPYGRAQVGYVERAAGGWRVGHHDLVTGRAWWYTGVDEKVIDDDE